MAGAAGPAALKDDRGLAVATSSRDALDATERALWRMLSFDGTPLDDLDRASAADPGWAWPILLRAGFLLSLTEASLRDEARTLLARAAPLVESRGDPRERLHSEALASLAAGDWAGADARWTAWLAERPRDAVALQWAHLLDFYRGDADAMLARTAAALPAWHVDDALRPYVLGMHAFGLEETGRHDEADDTGRAALAGTQRVPWAIHAVAHVMEMQGRHADGRAWLARWQPDWTQGNGFQGHVGWHDALFALEARDHAGALAAFDAHLRAAPEQITLQRVDAASLLWRLMLHGADVGGRWQALLDGWPLDRRHAGHTTFNDAHVVMALLGAGRIDAAEDWAAAVAESTLAPTPSWNATVARAVGAPLLHGLIAFAKGRSAEAAERLAPLRATLASIGGSHAQRDVVEQTLLAAAATGASRPAGRALLAERRRRKRPTPLEDWWAERLALPPVGAGARALP